MQADISFCVACNTLYQSVHSNVFFFCFKDPIIHVSIFILLHYIIHFSTQNSQMNY